MLVPLDSILLVNGKTDNMGRSRKANQEKIVTDVFQMKKRFSGFLPRAEKNKFNTRKIVNKP